MYGSIPWSEFFGSEALAVRSGYIRIGADNCDADSCAFIQGEVYKIQLLDGNLGCGGFDIFIENIDMVSGIVVIICKSDKSLL